MMSSVILSIFPSNIFFDLIVLFFLEFCSFYAKFSLEEDLWIRKS